jgi:hypothetical protein
MVRFKIVAQLSLGNQDCVQELLDLGIANVGIIQDFTDKVNRALHLEGMPRFFSLYN